MSAFQRFSFCPYKLPTLSVPRRPDHQDDLKEIEAFIRSAGGKPMTRPTKQRLAKAGCLGFPTD
jgi:hypothetical protein